MKIIAKEPPDSVKLLQTPQRRKKLEDTIKGVVDGLEALASGQELNGEAAHFEALQRYLRAMIKKDGKGITPEGSVCIGRIYTVVSEFFGNQPYEMFPQRLHEYAEGLRTNITRQKAHKYMESLIKFETKYMGPAF